MVVISFSIFKDKLLSGEKDQTIRPYSECRYCQIAKKRKKLQIFWNLRSKNREFLFEAEPTEVFRVWLDPDSYSIYKYDDWAGKMMLSEKQQMEIIKRDGFSSREEFFNFFIKKYGREYLKENIFILVRFVRIGNKGVGEHE